MTGDVPPRVATGDGGPSLSVISDQGEYEGLKSEWDELVRGSMRPSPFLLHGFLTARWRHYAGGDTVAILCARRGGALVGALPLVVRRERGVRVAELLCGWYASADLLLAQAEPFTTGSLMIERASGLPLDYLRLRGLEPESCLERSLGREGEGLMAEGAGAPVLDMPHGWEEAYARHTTSKARNHHRRRLRRLERVGAVEFDVARSPDQLDVALEDALRLHELRWRERPGDQSDFASVKGAAFQRDVVRFLGHADTARIVVLRLDGRAIAFHYFFALQGTMVVHRLAFDPEFADCSPGVLTTLRAVEIAADEGLRRVDFLRGDERYKLQLADRVEPLRWGTFLVSGRRAVAVAATERLRYRARQRLKQSDSAVRMYRAAQSLRSRFGAGRD